MSLTKQTGSKTHGEMIGNMSTELLQNEAVIRSYLFGRCAPEDAASLEEQYFRDPKVFDAIDALEQEILRDFIRRALPAEESSWIAARRDEDPVLNRRIGEIASLVQATADLADQIAGQLGELYAPVLLYFRHRNPTAAEDCTQETMLRAFRLLVRQDVDADGVRPFVFRVASYVSKEGRRDRLLAVGGTSDLERFLPVRWLGRPENQPEHARYQEQLLAIVRELLTEDHRELLYRYYRTTDREFLAAELNMSPSNLRLRVFRIRKKLQEALRSRLGSGGGANDD